jgi:AraC-like DNA-binding protein
MNDRVLVVKMIAYIEQNLVEPIGAEELALKSGYSLNRFRQKFFNVTGDTPSGYLRKRRLTEAAKEILAGAQIAEVALKYGYSSQDNFTTAFRSFFGVTPSEIAKIEGKYKRFIRTLREVYSIMEIANLKQPPLNTTLMGCLKGASDYFDNDLSAAMLFGLSGHAFLLNIHEELCPSGPYVWKKDRFFELLEGLGIKKLTQYQISKDAEREERARIELKLKEHMEAGDLFMLDFLEHQLASGYDERGFLMLQPWNGRAPSEIPALSFGSWQECFDKEGWAHFTVLSHTQTRKGVPEAARDALSYAMELYDSPGRYEVEGYRIGFGGYDNWIECVKRGLGAGHGHWWNAQVWAECRWFAGDFFGELSELVEGAEKMCGKLSAIYKTISESLSKAGQRDLAAAEQLRLLESAREQEREAQAGIESLLKADLLR